MTLKDKSAIVTGAGRGLGKAIAVELALEGADVMLFSRTEKELTAVADEIRQIGGTAFVCQGDLSDTHSVCKLVAESLERFSTIDILVNNAAVIGPANFLGTAAEQEWQAVLNIKKTPEMSPN